MEDTFKNYVSYYSLEDAQETIELIAKNNIEYKIEENFKNPIGEFYVGSDVSPKYVLKIKSSDFQKAEKVLSHVINPENSDHYLNDYSTEELKQILAESDKWSPYDVSYALELLNNRGIPYTETEINELKEKRIKELSETKKGHIGVITLGYFLAAFGIFLPFSLFWIILAPLLGLNYYYLSETLPNGEKINVYDELTRKRGMDLLIMGCFAFIIWTIVILFFPSYIVSIYDAIFA